MRTCSFGRVFVLMFVAVLLSAGKAQCQNAPEPHFVGKYSGQPIKLAGEDDLYFLAVAWQGPFTFKAARDAWHWGTANVASKGSLVTRRNDYRTDGTHHIVIGWVNKTEVGGRWIAATNAGKLSQLQTSGGVLNPKTEIKEHGVVEYIVFVDANEPNKDAGRKAEWIKRQSKTRGYTVQLSVACDDQTGDIAACFDPPQ